MALEQLTITISGPHNTGRSTIAILFKQFLEETGYKHVRVEDTEPLPAEQKDPFIERFERNRALRPVRIRVVTEGE